MSRIWTWVRRDGLLHIETCAYILAPLAWHIKYDDKVDPKDQSLN